MMETVSYRRWSDRLEEITPADHRIGTDLILIRRDRPAGRLPERPFKSDMTLTICFDRGSARIRINMREYHVQAPCIVVIQRGRIYEALERSDDVMIRAVLMSRKFTDSMVSDLCRIHSLGASLYSNPVLRADGIERVFGQYFDLLLDLVSSPYIDVRSKTQAARHLSLSMFYGYTCRIYEVEDIRKHTRQEETVSRFLELLYAHHRRERSVAFYAGELCMTPKYLSRIVREVTGRSALESIEDYVVTEAKAMLNSTSMTVQQISDGLNFPSQSVFGKYFKRVTGMSPKEYRDRG